ncbi:MAG: hypothetical protein QXM27_02850 [Candidatus Pacearchaeota archaeon]
MRKFLVFEGVIYYRSFDNTIVCMDMLECFTIKLNNEKEIDLKKTTRSDFSYPYYYGNKLYSDGKKYYLIYEKKG